MDKKMLQSASEITNNRRLTKRWQKVIAIICTATVLGTSYALILPAITEQANTFCGHEEHIHSVEAGCYEEKTVLDCSYEETPHVHSDECYKERRDLICNVPENKGHHHDESCYKDVQKLVCKLEESEGHQHNEKCYDENMNLICGKDESEGHTHSSEAGCYKTVRELVCGLEENEGHTHSDSCFKLDRTLICGHEEGQVEPHTHTEKCYHTERIFTCDKEEHQHTLACFSNPDADVESSEIWKRTFRNVELTGVWADDVLAIADTQLGYEESTRNYIVEENGETIKGYTRYGAWYGDAYGDWCAMFCSFCLNYADVDCNIFPIESGCQRWTEKLKDRDLYYSAGKYDPKPGDLVFFDWDKDSYANHVGFVYEVSENSIKTLEGNSGPVGYHTYNLSDSKIMGFGELPENPNASAVEPIDQVLESMGGEAEDEPQEDNYAINEENSNLATDYKNYNVLENGSVQFSAITESGYTVLLTANPDTFELPLDELSLSVNELKDEAVQTILEDTVDTSNPSFRNTLLFDIKIMHGEEEVQPKGAVSVEFIGLPHVGEDAKVFHVTKNTTDDMEADIEEGGSLSIITNHFSIYGVTYTYTVDFHYEGQALSIPGGSSILLSELFDEFSINENVSLATEVSFSDPSLIDIKEIGEFVFPEEIGEDMDPESMEIKEDTVKHDWCLTSLLPFDTDELLTIVFADGSTMEFPTTDLAAGIASNAVNKVIKQGDETTFSNNIPFYSVDIEIPTLKETMVSNLAKNIQITNLLYTDSLDIEECIGYVGNVSPGATIKINGTFAVLTFKDAAIDVEGNKHDVKVTFSNLNIKNGTQTLKGVSLIKVNKELWIDACATKTSGEYTNKIGTSMDVTVQIVGVTSGTSNFHVLDLDQPDKVTSGTSSYDSGSYSERMLIKSDAKTKAYIPSGSMLNITNPDNDMSATANGLLFRATASDGVTFNSGFITVFDAGKDFNTSWSGSGCGTMLMFNGYRFSIRPQYKSYQPDGTLSNWNVGNTGGTITMLESYDGSTISWDGNTHTSDGNLKRLYTNRKNSVITVVPQTGYKRVSLTRTTGPSSDPGNGVISEIVNNASSVSAYQSNVDFNAFYEPITGSVTIAKTDSENGDSLNGAVFNMSGTSSVHGSFSLTSTDNGDGTYTIENVPYGISSDIYTITEISAPEGYEKAASQTVTGDQFSTDHVNVALSFEDKPMNADMSFKVTKCVVDGDTDVAFPFEIMLKDITGNQVLLSTGIFPAKDESVSYTVSADGKITFSLKHNESVIIENIPTGVLATVKEISHDGYATKVMDGAVQLSNCDKVEDLVIESNRTITYYNNSGTILPETGGIGTKVFTWAGLALLLGGAMYGVCWRRRRERRVSN